MSGFHLNPLCAPDSMQRKPARLSAKSAFSSLVALVVFLFIALVGCAKEAPPVKAAPPEVLVASVAQQNVPIYGELVCQLNGPVNAEITPKVQGYLLQQNYQNGFFVQKGQLLFTLDPRQYEAEVEQAKSQVKIGAGAALQRSWWRLAGLIRGTNIEFGLVNTGIKPLDWIGRRSRHSSVG
jgi:membrane fusion protein (multidrug efflux system)